MPLKKTNYFVTKLLRNDSSEKRKFLLPCFSESIMMSNYTLPSWQLTTALAATGCKVVACAVLRIICEQGEGGARGRTSVYRQKSRSMVNSQTQNIVLRVKRAVVAKAAKLLPRLASARIRQMQTARRNLERSSVALAVGGEREGVKEPEAESGRTDQSQTFFGRGLLATTEGCQRDAVKAIWEVCSVLHFSSSPMSFWITQ